MLLNNYYSFFLVACGTFKRVATYKLVHFFFICINFPFVFPANQIECMAFHQSVVRLLFLLASDLGAFLLCKLIGKNRIMFSFT